jgi:hypothetical protein
VKFGGDPIGVGVGIGIGVEGNDMSCGHKRLDVYRAATKTWPEYAAVEIDSDTDSDSDPERQRGEQQFAADARKARR